ncbi:beta-galactosidase [Paenibacillus filicis]|uniref:Beta-galactosidase n=1 Tax=Paenibacillus gyeongsangnamensis TaxID=3388067 RepID=A0ABT4QJ36_9BACL|nr:alpha-amylase family protein [Paenibacillus filicis]MCZ8516889.1 beta-galactosidase [Paenibacillus filicis]
MSKTIVFYDESFPYPGVRPDQASLHDFSEHVVIADAKQLGKELNGQKYSCFVNLHGPYFPKNVWKDILAFLSKGGGLVHLGGAPFKFPVYEEDGTWLTEHEQTAYHGQLGIHEALEVNSGRIESFAANADIPILQGKEALFEIKPTYGLILHVTKASDHPHHIGSSGPMDTHIYPLLKGMMADGRESAAPAVLMEHTKGSFAGGRWMLINQAVGETFWSNGGAGAVKEWAEYCSRGVTEMWLKPNYGCYEPGESPVLTIQAQAIGQANSSSWTLMLEVIKQSHLNVHTYQWEERLELEAGPNLAFAKWRVPLTVEPGFYSVTCKALSDTGEVRILRQAFWGFDAELLQQGMPLSCDRDYFWKDGKPLPIVGMTYMTSDVARKYLFLPNPSVWDRDMAQMKRAGVNLIRTGIWSTWRQIMFVDGHPSEEVLRAIDAFVLTARRHDMEVTFNFFAFTPEAWEGDNPYLDPRSVEAQKRLIAAVVARHARTANVQWDLINEPSMFDPKRPFQGPRSAKDSFEIQAFIEWVKERHGSIRTLQERWNMTPAQLPDFSAVRPPEPGDINFDVQDMSKAKKGVRWLDYTLFTMEMHNRWARELASVIKSINPSQLVTVGQDEGLAGQRPSPFFYAEAVDYTTVHSWWKMDELVWDGVFAKDTMKPNLVQETGIMYVETPDGRAKRSEEELRNILERKYAYAFSTGGAGAVQWIWNTNFYMDNVNESNIGALRADGTEKPEADVTYDFGRFIGRIQELFVDRKLEDIAVVFPYSNDFSNRKLAFDATSRLCRVLHYEMNVPFRGIGEYHLQSLQQHAPRLIIVPSAHNVSDAAMQQLISHIESRGGVLVVTGPVSIDEYWRYNPRLTSLVGDTKLGNIVREEIMELNGKKYPVSFGGRRIAELTKESERGSSDDAAVREYTIGKGRFIWCPLPLELNLRSEPIHALYRYVMSLAGVEIELDWKQGGDMPGIYGRKLQFKEGALFIFVSECSADVSVDAVDPVTGTGYEFTLEKERTVMFATDAGGAVTAVYRPDEVSIHAYTHEGVKF